MTQPGSTERPRIDVAGTIRVETKAIDEPMTQANDALHGRLEVDRRDLLDLTLRNPLLNYKPRVRGLELTGAPADALFRLLVRDGRSLDFLAAPPEEREDASSVDPAEASETSLRADLPAEALEDRLLKIAHAARTAIEEQGVNTLFLALAMLRWYEDEHSTRELRAPLILLPVGLTRPGARDGYRLRHDGEDPETNLSLIERLRTEFGISLSTASDQDELDVNSYLDAISESIRGRARWSVDREAIALGFFSFGKYRMYRDLDPSIWPGGTGPGEHRVLRALLGDGFEAPPEAEQQSPIPLTVLDADVSQRLALREVASGSDLVIQGPPGTGKSQTIANLIADAVGRGRTVLFVAEKLAALEVVKRRLDAVGLGNACLELHSHRTGKRSVLDQLRRTLSRAGLGAIEMETGPNRIDELAARLDSYCEAINTPVGSSGITPHVAIGELIRLREQMAGVNPPSIDVEGLASWDDSEFTRRLELVVRLQGRRASLGDLRGHPFFGCRKEESSPSNSERLGVSLRVVQHAMTALRDTASALAVALGLDAPTGPAACEGLVLAADRAAELVGLRGALEPESWVSRREDIRLLLVSGSARSDLRRQYGPVLLPEAWEAEVFPIRQAINAHGRNWWSRWQPAFRKARNDLAGLCRGAPPRRVGEQLALLDAVLEARRREEVVRRLDDLGHALFARHWEGVDSDWRALQGLAEAVDRFHEDRQAGRLPRSLAKAISADPNANVLRALARSVEAALSSHREAVRGLLDELAFDESARFGAGSTFSNQDFDAQERLLVDWSEGAADLPGLLAYNELNERCRREGLGSLAEAAESWDGSVDRLADVFRLARFEAILRRARHERPALADFDRLAHEAAIDRFRIEDHRLLASNQATIADAHRRRVPRHSGGGQLAILRRELAKRARHLPVRKLMERAGDAVKATTPVFLMSPLSVAAYLPPGLLGFDLVLFDEASQVRPVDAFGSLLRADQAVVVGDSRQLPPTTFFDRLTGGDDVDRSEEESSADVESILGLFAAQGAPERLLRWHYRSRHESLIAVSNHEFYDGRLVVFPSPDAGREDLGLVLRHLPATTYDRGRTRTNPGEAAGVAEAVMQFARVQLDRPAAERESLGVATFSLAQMEAIVARLEKLRREEPQLDPFFAEDAEEPFFIKNLENVQGDERDVVFISIGYGRTADGSVTMNFGPINGEGGERRLNVLITRARRRCEVFTNLRAEDIDTGRSRSRGVQALRTFLDAAAGAEIALDDPNHSAENASALAAAVASAIEREGFATRMEIGEPGCRIDVAAIDPSKPGRYVLGITSDGASYRQGGEARDRDRLRPEVLERLGWRLHRVWGPEWLADPAGAARRLREAIDAEHREPAVPSRPLDPIQDDPPDEEPDVPAEPIPTDIPPYRLATLNDLKEGTDLTRVPEDRLVGWVSEVVEAEGPVHVAEVARRLADAAGLKRLGPKVQEAIESAVSAAERRGSVARRGDFLRDLNRIAPIVRDRSALNPASRRLELVDSDEVEEAILRSVRDAFGLEHADVASSACRLLGFSRTSEEMRRRIESSVDQLIASARLQLRGEYLQVSTVEPSIGGTQ